MISDAPSLATDRAAAIDVVSASLVPRASLATRLLLRQTRRRISRSEAGILSALSGGPRRITELADLEALMGLVDEGVEGAIIGTALYEGRFTLEEALALTREAA